MRNKGQAAMEFLMTYGWAILVVLAAIGALAYFGVLSPDRFLPQKCTLSAGFSCLEHKVNANGQIQMRIQNNIGQDLAYANVSVTGKGSHSGCTVTTIFGSTTDNGGDLGGAIQTYDCNTTLAGSKFSGDIVINYQISGQTVTHSGTGSITSNIE
ncbi:hypothetical protein ACFL1B_01440 [Nanoarchaeota archaeon]